MWKIACRRLRLIRDARLLSSLLVARLRHPRASLKCSLDSGAGPHDDAAVIMPIVHRSRDATFIARVVEVVVSAGTLFAPTRANPAHW
jgi:hypothetical protein